MKWHGDRFAKISRTFNQFKDLKRFASKILLQRAL